MYSPMQSSRYQYTRSKAPQSLEEQVEPIEEADQYGASTRDQGVGECMDMEALDDHPLTRATKPNR